MRISPIVLRLRAAETRFGNLIAGASELDVAITKTLTKEMAFVIDLGDTVTENKHPTGVIQKVIERFGVVCALRNDNDLAKQYGLTAYDNSQTVKEELWKSLVGWDMGGNYDDGNGISYEWADGVITYAGSRLLDVHRGYAWYQYEFTIPVRMESYYTEESEQHNLNGYVHDIRGLNDVNTIWTQYMLAEDPNLEDVVNLPVDASLVAMEQLIDETDDPRRGAFSRAFGAGFNIFTGE